MLHYNNGTGNDNDNNKSSPVVDGEWLITGSVDVVWQFVVCQISAPSPQAASVCSARPTSQFLSTAEHRTTQHRRNVQLITVSL